MAPPVCVSAGGAFGFLAAGMGIVPTAGTKGAVFWAGGRFGAEAKMADKGLIGAQMSTPRRKLKGEDASAYDALGKLVEIGYRCV